MKIQNELLVYEALVRVTAGVALKKALIQDFANRLRKSAKERALGMLRNGSCRECRYKIDKEYAFPQDPALVPITYCALKTTCPRKFNKYERGEIHDLEYSCKYFWGHDKNSQGYWQARRYA